MTATQQLTGLALLSVVILTWAWVGHRKFWDALLLSLQLHLMAYTFGVLDTKDATWSKGFMGWVLQTKGGDRICFAEYAHGTARTKNTKQGCTYYVYCPEVVKMHDSNRAASICLERVREVTRTGE